MDLDAILFTILIQQGIVLARLMLLHRMAIMYHGLHFPLGETYSLLRASVYQFACNEVAPLAESMDVNNAFPYELWKKLGQIGP